MARYVVAQRLRGDTPHETILIDEYEMSAADGDVEDFFVRPMEYDTFAVLGSVEIIDNACVLPCFTTLTLDG